MSVKMSAWRRSSSAIIGGCVEIVEMTVDAHAFALHGLHQRAEIAVAGEQHHMVDGAAISMASTASSMSMLPLILRRPVWSTNSLVALVTTE